MLHLFDSPPPSKLRDPSLPCREGCRAQHGGGEFLMFTVNIPIVKSLASIALLLRFANGQYNGQLQKDNRLTG